MTVDSSVEDRFLTALIDRLSADADVLGLVLAGSSAETSRRDRWSDHDFLVVTADGTPERYRTDLGWLPDADEIGFAFRETPHGLKALYRSGLLVEFAVFDRAEFASCALSHYAVAIDRDQISDLAREVHARTAHRQQDTAADPTTGDALAAFRAFLTLVYIGTGRARRGERLSANVFLRDYATGHLLRCVRTLLAEANGRLPAALDPLDPWRRMETADPELAAALDDALARPVTEVGPALLACAEVHLRPTWPGYPETDAALVRDLLGPGGHPEV